LENCIYLALIYQNSDLTYLGHVKNGLDLGENYRNINGCKNFAASIAQTLVDKPVQELKNINFLCISRAFLIALKIP
jgi:hypothetical protein